MSDIERELRDSLAENARRAPAGDGLAERIIAEAQFGHGTRERRTARSRLRTWTLPAVAAACVAAVVASIVIVASLQHPKTQAANTSNPYTTPPPTSAAVTSTAPATSTAPLSSGPTSSAATSTAPGSGPVPHAFHVADVTFVGPDDGWALGSSQCLKTPSRRCTALLHTTDGGRSWTSVTNPPANVGDSCADPCIGHVRFADKKIGYAYGQHTLLMTTDGGEHWTGESGGADALETLSGNVIRVTDAGRCPPGCGYQVLTAPLGSDQWQPSQLPGSASGDSVLLNRTGDSAYLLIQQHPAGGAGMQQPTLLTSSDDGRSWTHRNTPCPQDSGRYGEIDGQLMTTAEDGSVSLVCAARGGAASSQFTVTSTNGGTTFARGSKGAFGDVARAIGAASNSVLIVSADDTYRSTDSGKTWHPLGSTGPRMVSWIGFENAVVGRAISTDNRTIWTTTDAGATWSRYTFG
jgi:photosystem II stability/assembly factor-like uncharacterized protein